MLHQVRCFPSPGESLHFHQLDKRVTFVLPEPWIFSVLSWHRLYCPLQNRSLMFFSMSHPPIADNWVFQPWSLCVPARRGGGLAQDDDDNLDRIVSWLVRMMLLVFKVNLSFGLCRMVVEVFQRSQSWRFFSVNQEIIFHPVEQHPTCTLNGASKIADFIIKNRNKYWIGHVYVRALRL